MGQYFIVLTCLLFFSCSTTKKIKDGRTAFQQKQYAVAIPFLLQEADKAVDSEEYPEIAYLLGESYKYLNNSNESLKWFIESAKEGYGAEAFWEMAYALKKKERYDDAILSFQRLARMSDRKREIQLEIEKCRDAQRLKLLSEGDSLILEALPLNSAESDYAPTIFRGRNLVFTSDRLDSNGEIYAWTGNAFSDIYISDIDDYNVQSFDPPINSNFNEGTASFSTDGLNIFFTRCHSETGDSYCRIYSSSYDNGIWSEPELAFQPKSRVNYGDPVLIENDSVLIFVSDDPIGIGGHDLYYSLLLEDGTWDVPELMPPYLNTIGEERFPTWSQEDEVLYYSSDFFTGLGGLDIFKTTLRDDGSWTRPENLLEPINSSEDDYGYVIVEPQYLSPNLKSKAFFTSTRGIFGNDDIYSIYQEIPEDYEPVEETVTETIVDEVDEEPSKTFFLRIEVFEKLYAIQDNPNSFVVGSRRIPEASLKITGDDRENIVTTDANGVYIMPLDSLFNYELLAGKEGYLNSKVDIAISDSEAEGKPDGFVFERKVTIDRIFEGIEIVIDNIYYDLNRAEIREDAKPALNTIIEIMVENPRVVVELGSHTDCRSDDDYNMDLSQRRAASAVNYIVGTGNIEASRISSVGYGESRLEINCICEECTEEEHQINRRTTFKIIR